MKANEFVKKFGLGTVKWILGDRKFAAPRTIHLEPHEIEFTPGDLKRLVESHELVEKCGGVDKVKQYLKDGNVFRFEEKPLMKQAVADVEACKEVPSESN